MDKLYDEEIALQSIYTIFKLLLHRDSREYICREPQCIQIIQSLSEDSNSQIKYIASLCLDVVVDYGDEWSESVREKRFDQHNQEWIQFIESLTETQNLDNIRPTSPNELMSLVRMQSDEDDDEFMDDVHSSMQLKNMHFISEFSDDDDDSDSLIVDRMQRSKLSVFD